MRLRTLVFIAALGIGFSTNGPSMASNESPDPVVRQSSQELIETSKLFLQDKALDLQLHRQAVNAALEQDRLMIATAEEQRRTQLILKMMITALVFIITGSGLWMSYIQFRSDSIISKGYLTFADAAAHSAEKGGSSQLSITPPPPPTSLRIGSNGLEINSSVIGLIVLVVSLAFFYLYIDRVYTDPIYTVPEKAETTRTTGAR